MRWNRSLLLISLVCCAGFLRAEPVDVSGVGIFSEYEVSSEALGPAEAPMGSVMKLLAADYNRVWLGVNPKKEPEQGELAVFVIDSQRAVVGACRNALSLTCTESRASQSTCAAIDSNAIVCNARFVVALLELARHSADDARLSPSDYSVNKNSRFDEFFEESWSSDLEKQLRRVSELTRRLDAASFTAYRNYFDAGFLSEVSFALAHEYGHIALGHTEHLVSKAFGSQQELQADAFAIEWIAREMPLNILAMTPAILDQLQEYWIHVAATLAGFKGGTIAGAEPTEENMGAYATALLRLGLCDESHPSARVRMTAIASSRAFAPAIARWPAGYFDRLDTRPDYIATVCRMWNRAMTYANDEESLGIAEVHLLDPGEGVKSKLRYKWRSDAHQTMVLTVRNRATRRVNSKVLKPIDHTAITKVDITVKARHGGRFYVGVQTIRSSVTMLQRLVLEVTAFDDRGFSGERTISTKEVPSDHWNEDPDVARIYSALVELRPQVVILPDEPIGIGGSWSISSKSGGTLGTTKWTLVSRSRDVLALKGTVVTVPDGEQSTALTEHGSADLTTLVNLSEPSPRYTSRYSATTIYSEGGDSVQEDVISELNRAPASSDRL